MELNADFSQRAVVHAATLPWLPSPMPGVDRRMLDRIGDEVARATSIVRYAENSQFSPHTHTGGEEFFVLSGTFQDEHGDFPAGTYVRNPPTSSHTPGAADGCVIFVKLWQFDPEDRTQITIDTNHRSFHDVPGRAGVASMLLFADAHEEVSLERWDPNAEVVLEAESGLELLVLDGDFTEGDDAKAGEKFSQQSWLRLPKGETSQVTAGAEGARVWTKRNHLAEIPKAPRVPSV